MTMDAEALTDLKRSSPLVISISQLAARWRRLPSATARRLDKWVSEGHISKSIVQGRILAWRAYRFLSCGMHSDIPTAHPHHIWSDRVSGPHRRATARFSAPCAPGRPASPEFTPAGGRYHISDWVRIHVSSGPFTMPPSSPARCCQTPCLAARTGSDHPHGLARD